MNNQGEVKSDLPAYFQEGQLALQLIMGECPLPATYRRFNGRTYTRATLEAVRVLYAPTGRILDKDGKPRP